MTALGPLFTSDAKFSMIAISAQSSLSVMQVGAHLEALLFENAAILPY